MAHLVKAFNSVIIPINVTFKDKSIAYDVIRNLYDIAGFTMTEDAPNALGLLRCIQVYVTNSKPPVMHVDTYQGESSVLLIDKNVTLFVYRENNDLYMQGYCGPVIFSRVLHLETGQFEMQRYNLIEGYDDNGSVMKMVLYVEGQFSVAENRLQSSMEVF